MAYQYENNTINFNDFVLIKIVNIANRREQKTANFHFLNVRTKRRNVLMSVFPSGLSSTYHRQIRRLYELVYTLHLSKITFLVKDSV